MSRYNPTTCRTIEDYDNTLGFSFRDLISKPLAVVHQLPIPKPPSIPAPPALKKALMHANTIAQGIVLPHGLQSKAARKTHIGHMHNSHTGMIVVNGALTYFTGGIYAAIVGVAAQKYKDRKQQKLTDHTAHIDTSTQSQLDSLDAEAERLTQERKRIADGGAVDPNFVISSDTGATLQSSEAEAAKRQNAQQHTPQVDTTGTITAATAAKMAATGGH